MARLKTNRYFMFRLVIFFCICLDTTTSVYIRLPYITAELAAPPELDGENHSAARLKVNSSSRRNYESRVQLVFFLARSFLEANKPFFPIARGILSPAQKFVEGVTNKRSSHHKAVLCLIHCHRVIGRIRKLILHHGPATGKELKDTTKEIRKRDDAIYCKNEGKNYHSFVSS
ncbi:pyruvate dehydrogenase E1 component alpha subunit [Striga asiatica]|uniref:Pyruvate dehydrogenase E1 component alpha subunit n=1 Tax=Striga asiatica TaxID=4170 RepID=A0A5A7QN40_STRAF|nr:pyruvate dehydrogenase E1 component alpha subunit [Striga asiatica]